jgi:mono/diheme cytochrome c family protein
MAGGRDDEKAAAELWATFLSGELGFRSLVVVQRQPLNRSSHIYTYHEEGFKPGGGLCVVTFDRGKPKVRKIVDAGDGQIQRCDLSFDGREIVFNWRKGPEHVKNRNKFGTAAMGPPDTYYQVYRVNVDGTNLTQLTHGTYPSYDACWLPDGGIVFLAANVGQMAYCWGSFSGVLHRMDRNGKSVRRLSWNYLHDFTPSVMSDGRILYSRWEYVDKAAIPIQSLWTINPDGTNLQGFYGNRVINPTSFVDAHQIPGSPKALSAVCGHTGNHECGGAVVIDRRRGDNAWDALTVATPDIAKLRGNEGVLRRNLGACATEGPYGRYCTPYPVDDKYFLVSREGAIQLRDYDATQIVTLLPPEPGDLRYYSPRPLRARRRPPERGTSLADTAERWATLYIQDVYQGLLPHVERGEVKQIAVVEELRKPLPCKDDRRRSRGRHFSWEFQGPAISAGATYAPKRLWGFATVRQDGSAYFRIPAETPIYFLALDAEGRAVQRMRTFTHLMPGEVQGCIGCHEPRNTRPVQYPKPMLLDQAPEDLTPPEWGVKPFYFPELVQPVLDEHCTGCHGEKDPPQGVRLTGDAPPEEYWKKRRGVNGKHYPNFEDAADRFSYAYGSLVRDKRVHYFRTDNGYEANIVEITPKTHGSPVSKLADLIVAGHRDKKGKPRINLTAHEKRRIFIWIDLNIPFFGSLRTTEGGQDWPDPRCNAVAVGCSPP